MGLNLRNEQFGVDILTHYIDKNPFKRATVYSDVNWEKRWGAGGSVVG
jgi:hypothetical protein